MPSKEKCDECGGKPVVLETSSKALCQPCADADENADADYYQGHEARDFRVDSSLDASDNLLGWTEHGNVIKFDDQPFLCSKFDDDLPEDTDHLTRCMAHSLGGEDEVLVIVSGNPTKPSQNYGPQDLASGDSVTEVASDSNSREGWSPTDPGDWKDAEGRSSWGDSLSPFQERACKYKSHVVRRELVHGSYEEHIEGDMYTTIEGTWISKIKGNIWDTFYGYCHEDFNEHFEEVFYSTKSEVQLGDIVEYNYGQSNEYYYNTVVNDFGTSSNKISVTENYYVTQHRETVDGPKHSTYKGTVTEFYHDQVVDHRVNNINIQLVMGMMVSAIMGGSFSTFLGGRFDISPSIDLDISVIKIGKGGFNMRKDAVQFNNSKSCLNTAAAAIWL